MPCDAVNEHLLCRQWAAEDVCSHRYIALGCSVSGLENSLKRTLQSIQAWTPLPSTISVSIPRPQWCISAGDWHSWMDFLQGCYDRSWICNCATGLFVWFSFKKVQRWLWLEIRLYVLFFSFSAKKAYALLPLAETCLYSQIAYTEVFHAPVMTSGFSLLNHFPVRLPVEPSIFVGSLSWFLPTYSDNNYLYWNKLWLRNVF